MSDFELYQSVLLKLGQLPSKDLVDVDTFLSLLVEKYKDGKGKKRKSEISKLAGAWKNWDEQEFKAFLHSTQQVRHEMFSDRNFDL
jgi:chromosome segregation and condensation protein ScpB